MLKIYFISLFLILNYSIGFTQSIDSFQYDFIQLSDSKKLDFAMRKYKGHRSIPSQMKDEIRQQFKEKLDKKCKKTKLN